MKSKLPRWGLILFVAVAVIAIATSFGTVHLTLGEIINTLTGKIRDYRSQILVELRIPRVLGGFTVGAGLAVMGTALQSALRNPLADPYILGVSAGAAFGAALAGALNQYGFLNRLFVRPMAFLFALLASIMAYAFARRGGRTPVTSLILSGVVVSFLFNAGTTIMVVYGWRNIIHVYAWLFGSLSGFTWNDLWIILPMTFLSTIALTLIGTKLNAVSLGEEEAIHVGVDPERIKMFVFAISSLLSAVMVSAAGVVGFVGLIVPHMARSIFGPDNKVLITASAIIGGSFLVLSDAVARTLLKPSEIPLSAITALIGVPVFIYIMRRKGERW